MLNYQAVCNGRVVPVTVLPATKKAKANQWAECFATFKSTLSPSVLNFIVVEYGVTKTFDLICSIYDNDLIHTDMFLELLNALRIIIEYKNHSVDSMCIITQNKQVYIAIRDILNQEA